MLKSSLNIRIVNQLGCRSLSDKIGLKNTVCARVGIPAKTNEAVVRLLNEEENRNRDKTEYQLNQKLDDNAALLSEEKEVYEVHFVAYSTFFIFLELEKVFRSFIHKATVQEDACVTERKHDQR